MQRLMYTQRLEVHRTGNTQQEFSGSSNEVGPAGKCYPGSDGATWARFPEVGTHGQGKHVGGGGVPFFVDMSSVMDLF